MTKDDIIRMARDADHYANATHAQWIGHETVNPEWTVCRDERFAELVLAAERNHIAGVFDDNHEVAKHRNNYWLHAANYVRARSQS